MARNEPENATFWLSSHNVLNKNMQLAEIALCGNPNVEWDHAYVTVN